MNEIMNVFLIVITIVFIYCAGFASGETHAFKYINKELKEINEANNNNKR